MSRRLLDHHRELLERTSAIAPDVIAERGYRSADTKAELARIGFKQADIQPPALILPCWAVTGENSLYMARPDVPRVVDGKPLKYELPWKSRSMLDVHPRVRPRLGDPSRPLIVTEGLRKADAAITRGLDALSLLSVWMWRGTGEEHGKRLIDELADPEWLTLEGRRVYVVFDSDVMLKVEVHRALARLGRLLKLRHAEVAYVYLPHRDGGAKRGLDDAFADGFSIDDVLSRATSELRPEPGRTGRTAEPDPANALGERNSQFGEGGELHPELLEFAAEPDLLKLFAADMRRRGLVGEEKVAKLVKLAFTTRHLDRPIRLVNKGDSSTGKSYLLELVADSTAPEGVYLLSRASEKALVYTEAEVAHRVILLFEANVLSEEGPFPELVRTLMSEGRFIYETVERGDNGKPQHRRIEKQGPIGFASTTILPRLEEQLETRLLSLWTDSSDEQTGKVIKRLFADAEGGAWNEVSLERWQQLDRWLGAGPCEVVIPYGREVGELLGNGPPRLRRDAAQLVALIQAHALLHCASRSLDADGRIVATLDDYGAVRELMLGIVAASHEASVKPATRAVVKAVSELDPDPEKGVQQKAIAAHLGKARSSISHAVRDAVECGYLLNVERARSGRGGRPSRLILGEPMPEDREVLPTSGAVRERFEARSELPNSHAEAENAGQFGSSASSGESGQRDDDVIHTSSPNGRGCAAHPDGPRAGCRYCRTVAP